MSEGGVLSVQTAAGGLPLVFGWCLQCAVEAEGVEERHQEQEADDAEDDDYEDGVNVCVRVFRWEPRAKCRGHCRRHIPTADIPLRAEVCHTTHDGEGNYG